MPADSSRAASDPLANASPDAYRDWFQDSPNPFKEVPSIEFGADRSFAAEVELAVLISSPEQWPDLEKNLLDALKASKGRAFPTQFLCRMLSYVGSAACVPVVAPLLKDAETSNAARTALEPIESPEATRALIAALDELSGAPLAGLIGTLAIRGDRDAAPRLKKLQSDASQPAEVRAAAALALEAWNS